MKKHIKNSDKSLCGKVKVTETNQIDMDAFCNGASRSKDEYCKLCVGILLSSAKSIASDTHLI